MFPQDHGGACVSPEVDLVCDFNHYLLVTLAVKWEQNSSNRRSVSHYQTQTLWEHRAGITASDKIGKAFPKLLSQRLLM